MNATEGSEYTNYCFRYRSPPFSWVSVRYKHFSAGYTHMQANDKQVANDNRALCDFLINTEKTDDKERTQRLQDTDRISKRKKTHSSSTSVYQQVKPGRQAHYHDITTLLLHHPSVSHHQSMHTGTACFLHTKSHLASSIPLINKHSFSYVVCSPTDRCSDMFH